MVRRSAVVLVGAVLLGALAALPACKKAPPAANGDGTAGPPVPGPVPPAAGSDDHVLFAHLNAKAVRESAVLAEVKQATTKAGAPGLLEKIEGDESRSLGFRPTDLDSVTLCVTEVAPDGPKFVLILVSSKPFNKPRVFGIKAREKPDGRGFYAFEGNQFVHFPDDRTAVLLHRDLAPKYLSGYAKDRSAWPLGADLTTPAAKHTLYAVLNVQKLPLKDARKEALDELGALVKARTVTLTADLKGKELTAAGRVAFPDAATAGAAKGTVEKLVGLAAGEVETFTKLDPNRSQDFMALDAFKPVLREAHRAVKETKVEVAGAEVTLTTSYKADFDIAKLVSEAIPQIREAARRLPALNNLRQCVLGLHAYQDANGDKLPINGTGPKGALPQALNEKPLLSWRVAVLPFIEQGNLYQQFKLDEPWNSEHNKKLIEQMPKIFAPVGKPGKPGYTHVQMVLGPTAMRPGLSLGRITDGTSNTIALVEAAEPVIWTQPDDVELPKDLPKDWRKKFGGQFRGGFHVALWDGSGRFIPDTMSDRTLRLALDPTDGQEMPAEWELRPPRRPPGPSKR